MLSGLCENSSLPNLGWRVSLAKVIEFSAVVRIAVLKFKIRFSPSRKQALCEARAMKKLRSIAQLNKELLAIRDRKLLVRLSCFFAS